MAQTANFRIRWCAADNEQLCELARSCEQLVAGLKTAWLATGRPSPWTPQCEIVVHADVADYVATLGQGSQQTSGCATIRLDQGHVVIRRIDLRADAADWRTESLPHELTHVVLADRFTTRRISPWADEGIAMLAETAQKRNRRLSALREVVAGGMTYTLRDLLDVQTNPAPALRTAFYGQSVALVDLLLEWGSRQQLLQFVEASQSQGVDAALAAVYRNRPAAELERQLAECMASGQAMQLANHSPTR
jgi:hypothetical protein